MNKKRFQKVIDNLRLVKPENFNFDEVKCGSVACVLGHFPIWFPDLVRYTKRGDQVCIIDDDDDYNYDNYIEVASEILALSVFVSTFLFTPDDQDNLNLPICDVNSTQNEVADMLQKYFDREVKDE